MTAQKDFKQSRKKEIYCSPIRSGDSKEYSESRKPIELSPTGESNKQLYDAYNCVNIATECIDVNAGEFGTITLQFCIDCVPSFREVH